MGGVTSGDWNGTKLAVNFINVTPEREMRVGRATWEYSSDFKSVQLTSERFSDGKWWVFFKESASKVE